MEKSKNQQTSAGGVVWHKGRVLVLRNFRNEYIFPKGHLEAGESLAEAALREVAEEAGILATIISELPDTTYSFEKIYGGPQEKRVAWFAMDATSNEVIVDGVEIKWGAFMPPFEAASRLTHELDRELLKQAQAARQS